MSCVYFLAQFDLESDSRRDRTGYLAGRLVDASGAAGSRTLTVRPPSSRGVAWTSPPCALATDRTIDSPRPAPRLVEARVESACRSGVASRRKYANRLGTLLGAIGGPVMSTE